LIDIRKLRIVKVLPTLTKNADAQQEPKRGNIMAKFYYKNKAKQIVPSDNEDENVTAEKILAQIKIEHSSTLPREFLERWKEVKLYSPKRNVSKANQILIRTEDGAYSLRNKLNHLTGKKWTIFTCSWFIFNALHSDLAEEKRICEDSVNHPATYSPTMIQGFVEFFTKEGGHVLDPFAGIGSSLVSCQRSGRIGYGVELKPEYYRTIIKRVPEFSDNIVNGDSSKIAEFFEPNKFDFSISSPPYWDVLNRSTKDFKNNRDKRGLDSTYSNSEIDVGNISDYHLFMDELSNIYLQIYDLLKTDAYLVVIVKNIKKDGTFYPLAWDLAKRLTEKYVLKDERIWIQDKVSLAPYGYPYSWTANILHHYCLIFRKEL